MTLLANMKLAKSFNHEPTTNVTRVTEPHLIGEKSKVGMITAVKMRSASKENDTFKTKSPPRIIKGKALLV